MWPFSLFRKRQPVPTGELPPCDLRLYDQGECVGIYDTAAGSEAFEQQIREVSRQAGVSVDWHYAAGRAVVLTMPKHASRVAPILERLVGPRNLD